MKVLNFFKNTMLALSLWTMVFAPVAEGVQAQREFDRITQGQLKNMLIDLGLNKKITYRQFWDRTKHLYPAQSFGEIEAYFKTQPSTLMPSFEVTYSQNASGEKIPTLKITDRGQVHNVQIIGELNEWARANQVSLSESDLIRLKPAIEKLNPQNSKLETYRKDFARFEGFPRMTPQLWRSMKPQERAGYIIKMRLLWFDARRVIESTPEASNPPAQPEKTRKTSSVEEILKMIFGEEAQAAGPTSAPARTSKPDEALFSDNAGTVKWDSVEGRIRAAEMNVRKNISPNSTQAELKDPKNFGSPCRAFAAGGCVVAGQAAPNDPKFSSYTLTYNNKSPNTLTCACNYDSVIEQQRQELANNGNHNEGNQYRSSMRTFDQQCNEDVGNKSTAKKIPNSNRGKWVACQPNIYSFDKKSGNPFCVHTMSQAFQFATTFDGDKSLKEGLLSCDQQSRLGTKFDINGKSYDDLKAQIEEDQIKNNEYEQTKTFLEGMIAAQNKQDPANATTLDAILNGEYNQNWDTFLVRTQLGFEKQITTAMQNCSKSTPPQAPTAATSDRRKGSKPGASIGRKVELHHSNQKEACEQLHRRWLFTEKFIAQYRQKVCVDSDYIGLYAKDDRISSDKNKRELNLKTYEEVKELKVCKCRSSEKLVKFGESCTTPGAADQCPPGSKGADPRDPTLCKCENVEKTFKLVGADPRANQDLFATTCVVSPPSGDGKPPEKEERKMDCTKKYPGATPVDEATCICTGGSLRGDFPVPVKSTTNSCVSERDGNCPPESVQGNGQYTCDESNFNPLPWLAGLLAALGLYKIFKKKDKNPQQPICTAANHVLHVGQCICSFNVPGACPKGANADCTGCAVVPVCTGPKSEGVPPNCVCPAIKVQACTGSTKLFQPESCECQNIEGGTTPDTCTGSDCGGGVPGKTGR